MSDIPSYYRAAEVDRKLLALQEELCGLHKRATALSRAHDHEAKERCKLVLENERLTVANEKLLDKVMVLWEENKAAKARLGELVRDSK